MYHLFTNALVNVIYSRVSGQCLYTITAIIVINNQSCSASRTKINKLSIYPDDFKVVCRLIN